MDIGRPFVTLRQFLALEQHAGVMHRGQFGFINDRNRLVTHLAGLIGHRSLGGATHAVDTQLASYGQRRGYLLVGQAPAALPQSFDFGMHCGSVGLLIGHIFRLATRSRLRH